jgi:hypothetical protein
MNQVSKKASNSQAPQPDVINQATLTPVVRQALDNPTVEIVDWCCEQLHRGAGAGAGVYRFSGTGRGQAGATEWSLILKVVQPAPGGDNISSWNYYKREADAYRSGWLDDLPGGLAAPRHFGTAEHADGTCWTWLEDVTKDVGAHWPLEHYGVVARHAGQFNGAYLVDRTLPSWAWLSSGWLRAYVNTNASTMPQIRSSFHVPLVLRAWPGGVSDSLFRLWEERDLFFDALDRLPQTLCHLDLFRRNMLARKTADGDIQTVAVDWAYTGRGAIGEELVPLVLASVSFFEIELSQGQALQDVVFEGYLAGLRDAGWQGDPRQVRLGYTAASLRYRFADLWRVLPLFADERLHGMAKRLMGRPIEQIADLYAQVGDLVDRLTDEARELVDALD